MGRSTRPTANTSTSTRRAPDGCRSGGCARTGAVRSRSPTTASTTGSRISRPTESGSSTTRVAETWDRWARKHQLDPARVIAAAHGRRTIETVKLVAPHLAATEEVATLEASEAANTEGVFEVPGARQLLQGLSLDAWAIVNRP